MASRDYYSILGVSKTATADEIKKAYRKLAHQHHPDKSGGSDVKFKEINEAYQVLSDQKKRAQYDQFGSSFENRQGPSGGGFGGFDFREGFGGFQTGGVDIDLDDIFSMFGFRTGAGARRRSKDQETRGNDIEISVTISLLEAARGGRRTIALTKENICLACQGSGVKKGASWEECSVCRGTGEVRQTTGSLFGNFVRVSTCNICKGKGKIPKENCSSCKGAGRQMSREEVTVDIPAGIREGETLLARGKGHAGFRAGEAGDLYIKIDVAGDNRFARKGNDIFVEFPIKLTDAILGAVATVPTLDGDREVNIPAGSQSGDEFRLKGYGVHGRAKGDQIIRIKVVTPTKLSRRAKELVKELDREL